MRWYIKDYSTLKLSERIGKIDANAVSKKSTTSTFIVSKDEGHFVVQNDSVYRVHYDSKFTHFFFNDVQLICQHSDPIKEEIPSRIPVNYLCFNKAVVKYGIDKDALVLFCVEYQGENISDFYFEVEVRTADKLLIGLIKDSKKEINGFLSMLN